MLFKQSFVGCPTPLLKWPRPDAIYLAVFAIGFAFGCGRVAEPVGSAEKPAHNRSPSRASQGLEFLNPSPAQVSNYRRNFAILVGINQYQPAENGLPPLEFAVNDASALRDMLRDEFGYKPEDLRLLIDHQASRQEIERAIGPWLKDRGAKAEDAVLFFFAGHGLTDEKMEGYLAAADSKAADPAGTCLAVQRAPQAARRDGLPS